jgi:hypothetical protein
MKLGVLGNVKLMGSRPFTQLMFDVQFIPFHSMGSIYLKIFFFFFLENILGDFSCHFVCLFCLKSYLHIIMSVNICFKFFLWKYILIIIICIFILHSIFISTAPTVAFCLFVCIVKSVLTVTCLVQSVCICQALIMHWSITGHIQPQLSSQV